MVNGDPTKVVNIASTKAVKRNFDEGRSCTIAARYAASHPRERGDPYTLENLDAGKQWCSDFEPGGYGSPLSRGRLGAWRAAIVQNLLPSKIIFATFVDAMFTTFVGSPFTKALEHISKT